MNEPNINENFPWYKLVSGDTLMQGDFIPNCPVVIPPTDLLPQLLNAEKGTTVNKTVTVGYVDLIILSQSCDLDNNKIQQVLFCYYFSATTAGKDTKNAIIRGHRPQFHMVEKCSIENHTFDRQIIDFRSIYTLPIDFVKQYAHQLGLRVRLLPPYREHLSQAFARYFMRVGLPFPLKED
ncbi:MAG: hypothetical protein HY819_10685 [Acidobacteria bacterium]|nr:hypothetical protein [Acidobacteriota bacterium]